MERNRKCDRVYGRSRKVKNSSEYWDFLRGFEGVICFFTLYAPKICVFSFFLEQVTDKG